jgi:hypothetical protein
LDGVAEENEGVEPHGSWQVEHHKIAMSDFAPLPCLL